MTTTVRTPGMRLSSGEIGVLRAALDGELLTPESAAYNDARKVKNFMADRYPMAIARAATARDVATGISFARERGYPLVVRSGGHHIGRKSMADDAFVVDVSGLKGIRIDPATRIARVQSGVTSGELAGPAAALGLALTTGDTSSVGFGGLVTGGGIGFMVRKYGLTIDSLLSAQVVTADGQVVTASEHQHPDLFWAIRGGGGNFGVVTEFTFRMAPVPQILGGDLLLPATPETVRGYLEYAASAPDELSTIGNITHAAPVPGVPEELLGSFVLSVIVCWAGDIEAGQRAIAPLRALTKPLADTVRPMPYPGIYDSTAHQALPHGFALRSMYADELSDGAVEAMLAAGERPSSPFSLVHLRGLGGAMARVPTDATAFAHRTQRFLFGAIAVWLDPTQEAAPHEAWVSSLWEKVRHEGKGVYVNFLDDEGPERIRDAYPPETLARLSAIKRQYDPDNLFQSNQNIAPRP